MPGIPHIFTAPWALAALLAGWIGLCGFAAAEPDPALVAAARHEGVVVWYTVQIVDQIARPVAAAFERAYGIKVHYVRTNSDGVVLRILTEAQAGQVRADVFDGLDSVAALKARSLVMQWVPQTAARLGPERVDPDGYWVATNLNVLTPGFNTSLVPIDQAPKTFADLLDPRWTGKIVWNVNPTASGAAGFIGLVLATMGEAEGTAYLQQLARQDIFGIRGSARLALDHVIAGEAEIALNIFNTHVAVSADKGAPVGWIAMQPVEAVFSVASLTRDAPHPNAGKLLLEFLVSEAGQAIFRDADYIPADPAVSPLSVALRPDGVTLQAITFSPEQIYEQMPKWVALYERYFRD